MRSTKTHEKTRGTELAIVPLVLNWTWGFVCCARIRIWSFLYLCLWMRDLVFLSFLRLRSFFFFYTVLILPYTYTLCACWFRYGCKAVYMDARVRYYVTLGYYKFTTDSSTTGVDHRHGKIFSDSLRERLHRIFCPCPLASYSFFFFLSTKVKRLKEIFDFFFFFFFSSQILNC